MSSPITEQEIVAFILDSAKPLSVRLVERIRHLGAFQRVSWIGVCLLLTLLMYSVGVPWFMIGLQNGPGRPLDYVLGALFMMITFFTCMVASHVLYRIAEKRLPKVVHSLELRHTANNIPRWSLRFSKRNQGVAIFIVALIAGLTGGLTDPFFGQTSLVSIISTALTAFFVGLAAGNLVHFVVNFLSVTPVLLSNKPRMYALSPAETVGLRGLVGIMIQFMIVGAITGTITLSALLIYLASVSAYQVSLGYFSAAVVVVIVWAAMLIPFQQTLSAVSRVIKLEKDHTLGSLQALIDTKYKELETGDFHVALDDLEKLIGMYNGVRSSPSLPLELSTVGRIGVGFLLPLAPTLIQRLLH